MKTKNDFFTESNLRSFKSINESFDERIKQMFNKKYTTMVKSKINENKNNIRTCPDAFAIISDSIKDIDMCKYSIDYNFVNIRYVPDRIQKDSDFIDYIYTSFFKNRRRLSIMHKYMLFHMCEDAFNSIKLLLELQGEMVL